MVSSRCIGSRIASNARSRRYLQEVVTPRCLFRAPRSRQRLVDANRNPRTLQWDEVRREQYERVRAQVPGEVNLVGRSRKRAPQPVIDTFSAHLVVIEGQRSLQNDV